MARLKVLGLPGPLSGLLHPSTAPGGRAGWFGLPTFRCPTFLKIPEEVNENVVEAGWRENGLFLRTGFIKQNALAEMKRFDWRWEAESKPVSSTAGMKSGSCGTRSPVRKCEVVSTCSRAKKMLAVNHGVS